MVNCRRPLSKERNVSAFNQTQHDIERKESEDYKSSPSGRSSKELWKPRRIMECVGRLGDLKTGVKFGKYL